MAAVTQQQYPPRGQSKYLSHALLRLQQRSLLGSHVCWKPVQHVPSLRQSWPVPHVPQSSGVPQPSSSGPHVRFWAAQVVRVQPHSPAVPPPPHVWDDAHEMQPSPPRPHAPLASPSLHVAPSQQPAQLWVSQTHAPPTQRWPGSHDLQPSPLLPHAPSAPPPLHVAPSQQPGQLSVSQTHAPPTHRCSLPHALQAPPPRPHAPLVSPLHVAPSQQPAQLWALQTHAPPVHRAPVSHEMQPSPPRPHHPSKLPSIHVVPSQQPGQLWVSQTHAPPTQRWPGSHDLQPSPPLPQAPSVPPPMHVVPSQQPGQLSASQGVTWDVQVPFWQEVSAIAHLGNLLEQLQVLAPDVPMHLPVLHWRPLVQSDPPMRLPASASCPLRTSAPTAARPASPRSVCRRVRVWPKLRTSPSNRSGSMIMPSVTMHRRAPAPRPAETFTVPLWAGRVRCASIEGRISRSTAKSPAYDLSHSRRSPRNRPLRPERKVRHRGAGDQGPDERRMLSCLRPLQDTPPRPTVRMSTGSENSRYPQSGTRSP
jgi:hypothetical protein